METTARKIVRIGPCIPGLVLCAVWIVGAIVGVVYWAILGEFWLMLGSGAIPMFGAVTILIELLAG